VLATFLRYRKESRIVFGMTNEAIKRGGELKTASLSGNPREIMLHRD